MRTGDAIRRSEVAVRADQTVHAAAKLMSAAGVGALVVIDEDHAPIGIVTDRDLVRRSMARNGPGDARVDSVMSTPVVTIDADADVHSAFALFRSNGARRLVVVEDGAFIGVVSVDDLLIDLAADLSDLARPVTAETVFGHHDAAVPAARP